jgi:hypothetical protein
VRHEAVSLSICRLSSVVRLLSSDTMTLDDHLGAIYRERVISGADQNASAVLQAALAADPVLMGQARTRLEELRLIAEGRCFISAQHRSYLEAVLWRETT